MSDHDVRPDDLTVYGFGLAEEKEKYKNAFQSIDVPDDMTDRIMAALGGELPAAESKTDGVPHRRSPSRSAQQRGRSQRRIRFMHSAAGIAACLVMSVGMFTMTDPAGLRIIGLGTDSDDISISQIYGEENTPENSDSSSENRQQEKRETGTSGSIASTEPETAASSTTTDGPSGSNSAAGTTSTSGTTAAASGSTAAGNASGTGRTNDASGRRSTTASTGNQTNRPSQSSGTGNPSAANTPVTPAPVEEHNEEEKNLPNVPEPDQPSQPSDSTSQEDSGEYASSIQNPVRLAQSTASLSSVMSFEPDFMTTLPDGWMEVSAESIWGDTAQVVYSNGNDRVVYRTARGTDDISEDNNQYAFVTEKDGCTLKGMGKEKIYLVIWTENNRSYSISFSRAVDQETALSWAKKTFNN